MSGNVSGNQTPNIILNTIISRFSHLIYIKDEKSTKKHLTLEKNGLIIKEILGISRYPQ